jgi:hypothetical protein
LTSRVKDWTATLDSRNVLDVTMEIDDGHVVAFSVNYRARIREEWVEVVRYDTAHGHLHVHENWKAGEDAITSLEDEDDPDPPYNDALTYAEEDLKANWQEYREKMENEVIESD